MISITLAALFSITIFTCSVLLYNQEPLWAGVVGSTGFMLMKLLAERVAKVHDQMTSSQSHNYPTWNVKFLYTEKDGDAWAVSKEKYLGNLYFDEWDGEHLFNELIHKQWMHESFSVEDFIFAEQNDVIIISDAETFKPFFMITKD